MYVIVIIITLSNVDHSFFRLPMITNLCWFDAELVEQREASNFQAKPATVLQELPFEPQHPARSPIS